MQIVRGATPSNLTATGTVCSKTCQLMGFYVNSTSGGTIVLTNSVGVAQSGTITPGVGFHEFSAFFAGACTATIAVAAIDVTFFYNSLRVAT